MWASPRVAAGCSNQGSVTACGARGSGGRRPSCTSCEYLYANSLSRCTAQLLNYKAEHRRPSRKRGAQVVANRSARKLAAAPQHSHLDQHPLRSSRPAMGPPPGQGVEPAERPEPEDSPGAQGAANGAAQHVAAALELAGASMKGRLGEPPAAAAGAANGVHDEERKVEHEHAVLPSEDKAAKPVGYFSLFRCGCWASGRLAGARARHARQAPAPPRASPPAPTTVAHPGLPQVCRPLRLGLHGAGHRGRSLQRRRHGEPQRTHPWRANGCCVLPRCARVKASLTLCLLPCAPAAQHSPCSQSCSETCVSRRRREGLWAAGCLRACQPRPGGCCFRRRRSASLVEAGAPGRDRAPPRPSLQDQWLWREPEQPFEAGRRGHQVW